LNLKTAVVVRLISLTVAAQPDFFVGDGNHIERIKADGVPLRYAFVLVREIARRAALRT
jgi:hypothetical protein